MEILKSGNFLLLQLTDGSKIKEAANLILAGKAEGVNFNFTCNFPSNISDIIIAKNIKSITINSYPKSFNFDYSAINQLITLEELNIYTDDRNEINYSNFPNLKHTAIFWRPKANSLFSSVNLKSLFLGKYSEMDLSQLSNLEKLEYLRINTGSIQSLQGITFLQNLKTLYLAQVTSLKDISGINKLPKLEFVYIDNCKNINNIELIKSINHKVEIIIMGTTPRQ